MASAQELQTRILRRAKSSEDYAVYRAALEWGLADPIVIESRDDFKSEFRWKDRLEPFYHQVENLITFCRRLPVTLLADDVGLGKTISAGLIASELIARNRIAKILVVAPKLLGPQWQDELGTKFDIPSEVVTGSKLVSAEPEEVGAVITTYHSARVHLDRIPDDRFDMLVLDEAHKLRNLYGVDPRPQVAKVFHRALQQRRFRYVLMLTATPIQNRLWDLYSLVDLLTVARGHENPFGSDGMFARRFIEDKRESARVLKSETRDEFRKIVYGYMSRVRRGDANLEFPERKIQLHRVTPTREELALIDAIAGPIQKLNRLAQISILQALTSSPHALMVQLQTMARNGTVPMALAETVKAIVTPMRASAKLQGLSQLVSMLKQENPTGWRMVVFTGRRETQTTIQAFLEELGLKVGIINGSSGQRNQDTIARFRANPPEIRAIVSTEAGSEGINLQVANVLINFDLPWNPMIVEQRVGRVQRLGSEHKNVVIYNVMLAGTFEEYIVGRLMTKLQMATDAIGDIESLLEASGVGDGEEGTGFDEKIRELVVAALAGRDAKAAAERIAQSIDAAKKTLEEEKENIENMLGSQDGYGYVGPQSPTLEKAEPSMAFEPFVRAAFASLGGTIVDIAPGVLRISIKGIPEYARLRDDVRPDYAKAPLYRPGSPAFLRLVDRVTASGLHQIRDCDEQPRQRIEQCAREWVASFGGTSAEITIQGVQRCFDGRATALVRATTAHDSYERLVDIACAPSDHVQPAAALDAVPDLLQRPEAIGLNATRILEEARRDPNIVEFNRFYLERRERELEAAGKDARRRKKLEDDFTPQIDSTLVALYGDVSRRANVKVRYRLDEATYESELGIVPSTGEIDSAPRLEVCALTRVEVPADCLVKCALSGTRALRHRLSRSEVSGRYALPEYLLRCSLSGRSLLIDEAGMSDITNAVVDRTLLRTCAITGKKGEPIHFGHCEFSNSDVLADQIRKSDVSGRSYRLDQEVTSVVSGKRGHAQEFVRCQETKRALLPSEAARCAKTGRIVAPDVLQPCAVTGKHVLPRELGTSSVSGKRVLREYLVRSSLSNAELLEDEGVRSAHGRFCAPIEARRCQWSGVLTHLDDLKTCALLGLSVHFQHLSDETRRLQPVEELLAGRRCAIDAHDRWDAILPTVASAVNSKKCQIEAALLSPDGEKLALTVEIRSLLGLRTQHAALLYSLKENAILSRIAIAKRDGHGGFR
ncbi:DEAD/DEAH box helicase [Bradyrhizobium sp. SZCCHNPS1003]|uniref:DEAD/DEAH box helicase n=1 Tax=Bradyrhizobium sp. SZCCHNPS1003 TaxID=3057330 RepID=UPI0028F1409C|nr:SNF2-related protein [Bradyrhizobium sp. SZCCHNPS1003]